MGKVHGRPQKFLQEGQADILLIYLRLLMLAIRSATRRGETGSSPPKFSKSCLVVRYNNN